MCSICHEAYEDDDFIEMTKCGHFYHQDCIGTWFKKGNGVNYNKCPSCRQKLEIIMHPEVAKLNEKLSKVGLGFDSKDVYVSRDD
uniref:RING-type domain-containing protein n=1 Tax=Meloidogyne incognita TaxID=6306 RepID=A0A914MJ79_MELIC